MYYSIYLFAIGILAFNHEIEQVIVVYLTTWYKQSMNKQSHNFDAVLFSGENISQNN